MLRPVTKSVSEVDERDGGVDLGGLWGCVIIILKEERDSSIHLFNTYLSDTYLVLSPMLGKRDAAKNLKTPVPMESAF